MSERTSLEGGYKDECLDIGPDFPKYKALFQVELMQEWLYLRPSGGSGNPALEVRELAQISD